MNAKELVDAVESYPRTNGIHRAGFAEFITVIEDQGILRRGNFYDNVVELTAMGRERYPAIATAYLMGAYE